MSEVKTIAILSVFGKETALIDRAHLDRVTAERNAALARLEEALVESLANQNEREVVCANYEALQQRLTAADERAHVLEVQLAESERKRREFVAAVKVEADQIEAKHSSCVVVPAGRAVVPIKPTKAMRDACQIAGKLPVWDAMIAAALKPAEGTDHE